MLSEEQYKNLVRDITESVGSFDHPNLSEISRLAEKHRISDQDVFRAVFVARDYQTLREAELLDGGTGETTKNTPLSGPDGIDAATFSKGE